MSERLIGRHVFAPARVRRHGYWLSYGPVLMNINQFGRWVYWSVPEDLNSPELVIRMGVVHQRAQEIIDAYKAEKEYIRFGNAWSSRRVHMLEHLAIALNTEGLL